MFDGIKEKYIRVKMSLQKPGYSNSMTYNKYPRDCKFDGKKILNLGCGSSTYPIKNVVNLDYLPGKEVDCVWDLGVTPLPFKTEEFDHIICNHILEHVPNWWECFKELSRIVKVGGAIEVWLPCDGGSSQLGYRDHINIINHFSFGGIKGSSRNSANIWEIEDRKNAGHVSQLKGGIPVVRLANEFWLQILPTKLQSWCVKHLRNVVSEHGYIFIKEPKETDGR